MFGLLVGSSFYIYFGLSYQVHLGIPDCFFDQQPVFRFNTKLIVLNPVFSLCIGFPTLKTRVDGYADPILHKKHLTEAAITIGNYLTGLFRVWFAKHPNRIFQILSLAKKSYWKAQKYYRKDFSQFNGKIIILSLYKF